MNNLFDIYVDSAANLTDEMVASTGIKIISYICTVNGKDMKCYDEGKPFSKTAKEFYELLASGAEVKTSLVGEETIIDAVTPSMQAGKDVLFITIASGISGTYSQAIAAQKTLKEKFPKSKFIV
ncbi:MAG: DegV family protein, partial [Clostridia bacterium]|nr:DegV family protein [Clostridia bacterium]